MKLIRKLAKRYWNWMRPKGDHPASAGVTPTPGIMGAADDLIPPMHMIFDGAATIEQFKMVGEGFTKYFLIDHARLHPEEKILDVGCGIGQKARVLAEYLSQRGQYEGIDIVRNGIDWCTEHYKRFPHFSFRFADIRNPHFNSTGKIRASEYRFPYEKEVFDVVFLSSVFTHMLPIDMENYLIEIGRVLKKGGRSVITYFLLNQESRRDIRIGKSNFNFPHAYESELCRIENQNMPEATVAHDEARVRALYEKNGLSISEITYGSWCGRKELVGSFQDAIIAVKE